MFVSIDIVPRAGTVKEFIKYINKINIILEAQCGMGVADLADYDFASAHEDGETPSSVVKQMLENEGFTM